MRTTIILKLISLAILLLLLPPVMSIYEYRYSNGVSISCGVSNYYSNTCFLRLYSFENSHASLCSANSFAPLYLHCWITANDSSTIIPIRFLNSCNNNTTVIIYLYKDINSHVSIYPTFIPVCLDENFSKIININTLGYGVFLVGLYQKENSHINVFPSNYNLYLNITNFGNPFTYLFPENNTYLSSILINFVDTDTVPLYKCYYRYVFKEKDSGWIERNCYNYKLTLNLTGEGDLWVYSKVINYAGIVIEKIYRYLLYVKYMDIETNVGDKISVPITSGKVVIGVGLRNLREFNISNISFDYQVSYRSALPYYIKTNCTSIKHLDPYSVKICTLEFIPYSVGTYALDIKFKGTVELPNTNITAEAKKKFKVFVHTDIKRTIFSADFTIHWLILSLLISVALLIL